MNAVPPAETDVLIVGAGSAGARLAESISAMESREVVVIEAGPDYRSAETPRAISGPNFAMAVGSGRYHWPELRAVISGRQEPQAYLQGRGVGGSSAINSQGATRAFPRDFSNWPRGDNPSWSWADVLPAFVAIEDDAEFGDDPYHGRGGPIPISRVAADQWGAVSLALRESAGLHGHPYRADCNAPDSTGLSPAAWTRRDSRRVSTNDAYLEVARKRHNMRILCHSLVERIVLDGDTATGVQIVTPAGRRVIRAHQILLCAGAMHSPALLLRSGIGPAGDLRALDIPVAVNLPGVGTNLHDHPMVWLTFPLAETARAPSPLVLAGHCALRFSSGHADGAHNDLEIYPLDRGPFNVSIGGFMVSVMHPHARGILRLASADPAKAPAVRLRALSHPADLARMAAAVRHTVELMRGPAFATVASGQPQADGLPLASLDQETLSAWLLASVTAYFHPVGTCRMGNPADPASVVDAAGRVHGVQGLRVADASVIPEIPGAGTHLTTVMLAERIGRQMASPATDTSPLLPSREMTPAGLTVMDSAVSKDRNGPTGNQTREDQGHR